MSLYTRPLLNPGKAVQAEEEHLTEYEKERAAQIARNK